MTSAKDDLDRIDELLTRCTRAMEQYLDQEIRPAILADVMEKLTRTKGRWIELEALQERNRIAREELSTKNEPLRITFDVSVTPLRTADVAVNGSLSTKRSSDTDSDA
jgi:hypothetical protein